jgi:hypothetical protein
MLGTCTLQLACGLHMTLPTLTSIGEFHLYYYLDVVSDSEDLVLRVV